MFQGMEQDIPQVTILPANTLSSEAVSFLFTQLTSTFQTKPFDGRCPYKGLDVFEEEDADLFFGRERLVQDLLNRVRDSRTVFITGPSGSGKSSLVRAGLIHALKQGAIKNLHMLDPKPADSTVIQRVIEPASPPKSVVAQR